MGCQKYLLAILAMKLRWAMIYSAAIMKGVQMLRTAFYRLICVSLICLFATGCIHRVNHRHSHVLAEAEDDYYAKHFAEAFRKSYHLAKTGDPRAEYAVGTMYFYGEGTVKDQDLARYWIRRAAYKHYPPAEHALYLLERPNVPQIKPGENFDVGYPHGKYIRRKSYCCDVAHKKVPGKPGKTCPTGVCSKKTYQPVLYAHNKIPKPQFAAKVIKKNVTATKRTIAASKLSIKPKSMVAKKAIKRSSMHANVVVKTPDPFYAWAKKQGDERYTIQLTVTGKHQRIAHLSEQQFGGKRVIPYSFQVGKKQRYSAVCGSFANQKDAQAFKKNLPKNLAQEAMVYRWGTLHKYMHPYS